MEIREKLQSVLWIGPTIVVLLSVGLADGQTVISGVGGFNVVDCPGGSDTIVTASFRRRTVFVGAVGGTPSVLSGSATIAIKGNASVSAGEFTAKPHYLQFTGVGSRAGRYYPVTANDGATITVDLEGDTLGGVGDGEPFQVVPYWTLATLFPPAEQITIHVSDGKLPAERKTQVLFFDRTSSGIALAPDRTFFLTADGWFEWDRRFPSADDMIIPPGGMFVIRHPNGAAATKYVAHEMVEKGPVSTAIRSHESKRQDNPVGVIRPVPVKLSELDLIATVGESAGNSPGDRKDELLIYDNVAQAVNKQPAKTYFRVSGEWRYDDGGTYPNANNEVIDPAHGVVVRKAPAAGGPTERWINLPRY